MNLPEITDSCPSDDRRQAYTFYGHSLLGGLKPIHALDSLRSYPTLAIGSTGSGKTQFLVSLAVRDMVNPSGVPIFFIDGKASNETFNTLYYYAKSLGKPFYCFFPIKEMDKYSCSWNPLHSTKISIETIIDTFFTSYMPFRVQSDSQFYIDTQRNFFTLLVQALHSSGKAFNVQDVIDMFENIDVLTQYAKDFKGQGVYFYNKLTVVKQDLGKDFKKVMQGFVNYLHNFEHWSFNSYNPEIQIDRLYYTDAVVYVGLPVNAQEITMKAAGALFLNQIKAFSNLIQGEDAINRRKVSIFCDEAAPWINSSMANFASKVRDTGMMLHWGVQSRYDLREGLEVVAHRIENNAPNIAMFNPRDRETADWFCSLIGEELHHSRKSNVTLDESGDVKELGTASESLVSMKKVHPDGIMNLRRRQYYYLPGTSIYRPLYLKSPLLSRPPNTPDRKFHGFHRPIKQELKGFFTRIRLNNSRVDPFLATV